MSDKKFRSKIRNFSLVALLAVGAVLSLATSKTLSGKQLVDPRVQNTTPLELPKPEKDTDKTKRVHSVWVKENVNNQGCFADQRADIGMLISVRNPSSVSVVLYEEKSRIIVDGEEYPITKMHFRYTSSEGRQFELALPPDTEGSLFVSAQSIFSKEKMKKIDEIRIAIHTSGGSIMYSFDGVRDLPMERSR